MRKGFLGLIFAGAAVVATANHRYVTDVEVPGDHFSLEGALELFKRSSSPEEFERLLNVPDSKVNNLDLNGDNRTDYIRVIDRYDGPVHAFILQAVISQNELQDIAVIELEKHANGEATLQIVGDADIYGVETIIEPTQEVRLYAGTTTRRTVVNVWAWPVVQYVYDPYYTVWISPWSWRVLPVWYYPWRPVSYVVYRPYWDPYRPYYTSCYYHRNVYAQRIYYPVRTTSVIVYNRHRDDVMRARNTRGRDYDRAGYYRGGERNRDRPQDARVRPYDNSRDHSAGRQRNNVSSDNSTQSRREGVSRDNTNETRSRDRSTYQQMGRDRDNTRSSVTPGSESRQQDFSTPRNDHQNNGRQRVEVQRTSPATERRTMDVSRTRSESRPTFERSSPSQRQSQSSSPSFERSVPGQRQNHSAPRVSESNSGHRNNGAASGGRTQSSGSQRKRGRE